VTEQALVFDAIFKQAPIGIAISRTDDPNHPEGIIVKMNSKFEQIIGRTKEEFNEIGWTKVTHPDDLEMDLENFRKFQAGEIRIYSMEKRYIKPDGSIVWVYMVIAPLVLAGDNRSHHICLVQDITERKAIEQALNESERSKSVFLSHLPGLAYRCNYDRNWTMHYVSNGCYNLTGYPPESLLNNRDLSYNDLISPDYREALWKEWGRTLAAREPFKYEYEIITATGEKKWVLELGQGVYTDDGKVEALEGIILDISNRKAIENALKYSNEHDKLTGLYNREYLVPFLEKEIKLKKETKKALVGINLSTIQLLAFNYGFYYAQNLVKKAADALKKHCRDNVLLFYPRESRFGFYIFDYKDRNELVEFSNGIVKTLESIFVTERIGGGIGIVEIEQNQDEIDVDTLLRRVLIASEKFVNLFGKDFRICFYDEELEALVNRERDIVEALNAIAADDCATEELFLQYQPIMDLRTGSIYGLEALARLRTAKLGLVSPLEFIPIAEKTKLILPIGEKVIAKALGFLSKLKEHGHKEIKVSVNTSVIQLLKPDFSSRLLELISKMQINPRNVGIEITESVFAAEFDNINDVIEQLKREGLHIALDDFGTGYSSLSRETGLKADCMKIDKYFVDILLSTNPDKAITSDIISIAHKLGHSVVAEGVTKEIQLRYLREYDCDGVQGYLISKPLDEDDALKFLRGAK